MNCLIIDQSPYYHHSLKFLREMRLKECQYLEVKEFNYVTQFGFGKMHTSVDTNAELTEITLPEKSRRKLFLNLQEVSEKIGHW